MANENSFESTRKRQRVISSTKRSETDADVLLDGKDEDKLTEKEKRKAAREKRRQLKHETLAKVPSVDENGISYTKQQVRRMRKRMEKGLNAIETSSEKHERLRYEAQLRREEELEYLGHSKKSLTEGEGEHDEDDDGTNGENDVYGNGDDDENDDDDDGKQDSFDHDVDDKKKISADAIHETKTFQDVIIPVVKKPRHETKEVPNDYVCAACQNKHQPKHWIYDCPLKVTKRKGLSEPSARKVFASGFPFSFKNKDITSLFESKIPSSKVVYCKMLVFQDTKRGKGQAFVTFDTEENAKAAMKLKGVFFDIESDGKTATKTQENGATKKKLELRVIKCVNRFDSKKTK